MKVRAKPKIAFFDFAGCEGCQLTVLDSLQRHPELLDVVEIVQFREAMSERGDDYQVAFVEGSYTRPEDRERLQSIREHAQIVIALGACAHLGGVNAMRNWGPQGEIRHYVYREFARVHDSDHARPISSAIPVDGFIPGCPIDQYEFIAAVRQLLQGRIPEIPDYPVCVECRLQEIPCLFLQGKLCLGSITRAGCGSICPAHGQSCLGCRGQVSQANLQGLLAAAGGYKVDRELVEEHLKLFQSDRLLNSEREGDGH